MVDTQAEARDMRGRIRKAVAYLHKLMSDGNTLLVTIDLFRLGTMGQVVALELHKHLTAEQQATLLDSMTVTVATDSPRYQQRRVLNNLVKMYDITRPPVPPLFPSSRRPT